jgi:hypothetical protein
MLDLYTIRSNEESSDYSIEGSGSSSRLEMILWSVYMFYTVSKVLAIFIAIRIDSISIYSVLFLYLILYSLTELYELLFDMLLCMNNRCINLDANIYMIRAGQASYEFFRVLINLAMFIELIKTFEGYSPLVYIIIFVSSVTVLKYIFLLLGLMAYLIFLRESDSPRLSYSSQFRYANFSPEIRDNEVCSICWDNIDASSDAIALECNHVFHNECIKSWANIRAICPMCRKSLSAS